MYKIDPWYPVIFNDKQRWAFHGKVADEAVRNALRYKSIEHLFKRGQSNPIQYINC